MEVSTPNVIVSYGGRFQPFHLGHFKVYQALVKKFGKKNVYITTSNKVEDKKSPLSFQWKKKMMIHTGVPSNKILQVANGYKADLVSKAAGFNLEDTIWISAIGEKDVSRLSGWNYFLPYKSGGAMVTADKHGYYYPVPSSESVTKVQGKVLSATVVRDVLRKDELDKKDYEFLKGALGAPRALIDTLRTQIKLESQIRNGTILTEGGMGGHMSNLYDDPTLKFSDLEKIIKDSLSGELNKTEIREKTDGQNLFASVINGEVRLSRNKSQTKNKGANSLDAQGIAKNWAEVPQVRDAFLEALKALETSFKQFSKEELETIFDNGGNWVNMEIMTPSNQNVFYYGDPQVVFHGLEMVDDDGKKIGVNADLTKKLYDKISSIKPGKVPVKTPPFVKLKKREDFSEKTSYFISKLSKFRSQQKVGSNATLGDWYEKYFEKKISEMEKKYSHKIDPKLKAKIAYRFGWNDKSLTMPTIKKELKFLPVYEELAQLNRNLNDEYKKAREPLVRLLMELGIEVLQNLEQYLSASPEQTIQNLRDNLAKKIKQIRGSKNPEDIEKMKDILKQVQSVGGIQNMVPTEGIIFVYNGKSYKLTGTFAPIGKLLGMGRYGR